MRAIGTISEMRAAERFVLWLNAHDMEAHAENAASGGATIWVVEEDLVPVARAALDRFVRNPADASFDVRISPHVRRSAPRPQVFRRIRRQRWGGASVTVSLMGLAVLVYLLLRFDSADILPRWLLISKQPAAMGHPWWTGLTEVYQGQIWRLFTPVLLHFGFLHILFNMMWLYDLGGMLERHLGRVRFISLVAVLGVVSNVAQYAVSGPLFGGMSGVVYGLLGYLWIRGRLDAFFPLRINPSTVTFMLAWLAVGFLGMLEGMANTAHLAGLMAGCFVGWWASQVPRR